MKAKVLHLTHTDIRTDARILKEIGALNDMGTLEVCGVGVLATENGIPPKDGRNFKLSAIKLYTKVFGWLPKPIRYSLNFFELTSRMLVIGARLRPDVVHCHDTLVLPAGVFVKWFTGAKLVYDAHELESDKNGQTQLLSFSTLAIERFSWPFVDHLITVSGRIIEWYVDNLGPKASTLILNSPELNKGDPQDPAADRGSRYFSRKFGLPEDALVFIYLGIIAKGRGIELALTAFAQDRSNSHFIMVGYGALVPLAKQYAEAYPNIHYHEPVPHDEVVHLARSADVGICLIENVSLSDYYCLPNKLFEYAFAGLYVLSCDFPEIKEIVGRYGLGRTCQPTVVALTQAISDISQTGTNRTSKDMFELSWDAQATRLQSAYVSLLSDAA